jgi:hypothetical protein
LGYLEICQNGKGLRLKEKGKIHPLMVTSGPGFPAAGDEKVLLWANLGQPVVADEALFVKREKWDSQGK